MYSPVDGGFTNWANQSSCTRSCGTGEQHQVRTCTNPVPQHEGMPCSGPVQQSIACNEQPCPGIAVSLTVSKTKGLCQKLCLIEVDGEFTFWSDNGPCTKTCGTGSQEQTRTCTNPAPQHGGLPCEGPTQQTVACNEQPCPSEHIFVKYAPASLNNSVYGMCSSSWRLH